MQTCIRWTVAATAAVTLTILGTPAPATAAPAEKAVLSVPGAEVVPDSYVVVLKQDGSAVPAQARTLATDRGIRCLTLDYDAMRGMDDAHARLF